jgi:hypothetical protein
VPGDRLPSRLWRRWLPLAGLIALCCAAGAFLLLRPAHHGTRHCVYTEGGITGLRAFERMTDDPGIECTQMFNASATTWQQWSHPFPIASTEANMNWVPWVHADAGRQLILSQSLIPLGMQGKPWLSLGSRGAYTRYAVALAHDLIGSGLGHIIIRLAPEANGTWEPYSLPSTAAGLEQWREFWRRTVEAMRSVAGAHFAFEWDVNALVRPTPLSSFYPGDDVVNIIGIDAYEPVTYHGGWSTLANGADGVDSVARFAKDHGKPLSVPEWGAVSSTPTLGAPYIRGLADVLRHQRSAYECYFFARQYETAITASPALKAVYRESFVHR